MIKKKRRIIAVLTAIMILTAAFPALAAESPFMDVPAGHWAYDAVATLAARGIVSGYPDGTFRGGQSITRYEMAAIVARALAEVDREKASASDMTVLKKLVIEFHNELDAIGANLDKVDQRLTAMEENLGGWSFGGSLTFDMNWGDNSTGRSVTGKDNSAEFADGNISIAKIFDDGSYVYGRFSIDRANSVGDKQMVIDRVYWQGNVAPNIRASVGRFAFDWEKDAMLAHPGENSGWLTNGVADGFRGVYSAQNLDIDAIVARNLGYESYPEKQLDSIDAAFYAVKLGLNFSERGNIGAFYSYLDDDGDNVGTDMVSYGGWLGWEFTQGAALRGMYFKQDLKDLNVDDPDAWKAVLEFKRQLLGFTSLWVEYGGIDRYFTGTTGGAYNWSEGYSTALHKYGVADSSVLLVRADQQWNDKWSTFLRYAQNEYDLDWADIITNWTVGVNYQMTPAVGFQLAYDSIDYGNMASTFNLEDEKDNVIRFRTVINF